MKYKYGIKILFVLLITLSFCYCFNTYAIDCAKIGPGDFNIKFEDGVFKIKNAPDGLRFYANGDPNKIVSKGDSVTVPSVEGAYELRLSSTLKSTEWIMDCTNKCKLVNGKVPDTCPAECDDDDSELNEAKCTKKGHTVAVSVAFTEYDLPEHPAVEEELTLEDIILHPSKPIDCSKYNDSDLSFEGRFCYAKKHAFKKVNYNTTDNSAVHKTKCDANVFVDYSNLSGDDYYKNKTHLYGYKDYIFTGQYLYHYSASYTRRKTVSCKIRCEEGVDVEYGPPVASKAGLCFEYKVRVTSRVTCGISEYPEKYDKKWRVCSPKPWCTGIGVTTGVRYWSDRGGPNDDFYSCMDSCDGGSYSEQCTDYCYNEVYGDTSQLSNSMLTYETQLLKSNKKTPKNASKSSNSTSSVPVTKVAAPDFNFKNACSTDRRNHGGCYKGFYKGSGSDGKYETGAGISWKGRKPIRYYGGSCPSGYIAKGDGICYHHYPDGHTCNDSCGIGKGSCKKGDYLNYGFGEQDVKYNKKVYDTLVRECEAVANCSTKQGIFQISVDYVNGSDQSKTIYFPYSTSNSSNSTDYVRSRGHSAGFSSSFGNPNTTLLNGNGDNPANDTFWGCYTNGDAVNLYRVPWTFPGTWINNKTGEISYSFEGKDSYWQLRKKKFCVPADAKDVNQKWFNKYVKEVLGIDVPNTSTLTVRTKIPTECYVKPFDTKTVTDYSDVVEYNIHAKTEEFGYFGWKINIDCFYGLNSLYPNGETIVEKDASCRTEGARVRTVNLEDLFPSKDGSVTNNKESTGRVAGFNWSDASVTSKNSKYIINPIKLIKDIQTTGYGAYSDKYLDYYFDLSKETLAQMKKEAAIDGKNYTNFQTKFIPYNDPINSNGISRYISSKIRNLPGDNSKNKVPDENDDRLFCNNIHRCG